MEDTIKSSKKRAILKVLVIVLVVAIVLTAVPFLYLNYFRSSAIGTISRNNGLIYTNIGDSIAAGTALNTENDPLSGAPSNSYCTLFAKKINAAKVNNLAHESWNTTNVLNSLKNDQTYINAVKESDIISIAIGSNDIIGSTIDVFLTETNTQNGNELLQWMMDTANSSGGIGKVATLLAKCYEKLKTEEYVAKFNQGVQTFENNFVEIIDTIKSYNKNAIILVENYYNPYTIFKNNILWYFDYGEIVGTYLSKMNEFVENHEYNTEKYYIVNISELAPEMINASFEIGSTVSVNIDPHPNANGHQFIANATYEIYKENALIAAKVVNGNTKEVTKFSSCSEAWTYVNQQPSSKLTLVLYTDWNAENGYLGRGVGFGSTGGIKAVARDDYYGWLDINLNGYTINRGLTQETSNGSVFQFDQAGWIRIYNGYITGGYSDNNGGAIDIENNALVSLTDVVISGNVAKNYGGGVYNNGTQTTVLNNVRIENNTAGKHGGGYYMAKTNTSVAVINETIIANNNGADNHTDMTFSRTTSVDRFSNMDLNGNAKIKLSIEGDNLEECGLYSVLSMSTTSSHLEEQMAHLESTLGGLTLGTKNTPKLQGSFLMYTVTICFKNK